VKRYSKALVAFLGAAATWAATTLDDDRVTNGEWAGLVAALLGVFAVYQVRNSPDPVDPGDGGEVGIVGLLLIIVLVLLVVGLVR
jgi:hypothetical protein